MKIKDVKFKNLPKKGYCGHCDDMVDFHIEHFKNRLHSVKGVEVKSDEFVAICNKCGNELWVEAIEEVDDKLVFDAYKKEVGLLTSQEIKDIRTKRRMSQKELAKFLSIGEKDITRYENGSIQTRAVDLMIRMVDNDETYFAMTNLVNKQKLVMSKAH